MTRVRLRALRTEATSRLTSEPIGMATEAGDMVRMSASVIMLDCGSKQSLVNAEGASGQRSAGTRTGWMVLGSTVE